jgi:hypothetical protein
MRNFIVTVENEFEEDEEYITTSSDTSDAFRE